MIIFISIILLVLPIILDLLNELLCQPSGNKRLRILNCLWQSLRSLQIQLLLRSFRCYQVEVIAKLPLVAQSQVLDALIVCQGRRSISIRELLRGQPSLAAMSRRALLLLIQVTVLIVLRLMLLHRHLVWNALAFKLVGTARSLVARSRHAMNWTRIHATVDQ